MIAALLTVLCIFSKQNGISLLILVPIYLIIEKKKAAALAFFAFTILLSFAGFVFFDGQTNHFFSSHVIGSLKNRIDPRWYYVYIFKLVAGTFLSIPLGIALVVSAKSIAENRNRLLKAIALLFVVQFSFSTVLGLKWGSSVGYYNESFLLAFLIIAYFCSTVTSSGFRLFVQKISIYVYPALVVFLFHVLAQLFFFFINSKLEAKSKFDEQMDIAAYLKKAIGDQDTYVLDLSNADMNFFKNILYKESAAPNIDAVRCCTLPDHIFDYTGLIAGLQNGKIAFIIKQTGSMQKSVWGVDIQNYIKDSSFPSYTLYKYHYLPRRVSPR